MATCKICNLTHFADIELQDGVCLSCEGLTFGDGPQTYHVHVNLAPVPSRIVMTTEDGAALDVQDRLEVITAECAFGHNLFSDLFTQSRHVYGGRTAESRAALRRARRFVLAELREEAAELGANAVIGVRIQYQDTGDHHSRLLMLIASGTAVILGPPSPWPALPERDGQI